MANRVERVACLLMAVGGGCVELPRSRSATEDDALLDASTLLQDGGARRPPTADGPPPTGCWSDPGAGSPIAPQGGDGGLPAGAGGTAAAAAPGAAKPRRPAAESTTFDLAGCALDDGGARKPITDALLVPPGGFVTLARSEAAGFVPDLTLSFSLANQADAIALACDAVIVDRVVYGAGFPLAPGVSMALDPAASDATSNDQPGAWCLSPAASAGYGELGTPGAANPPCHGDVDSDAGR